MGLIVAARIWEFAALSLEFEEPNPLGIFDNLRKGRSFSASVTEAPARYRTWTSHYPGERATDYTTGLSRGHLRVTRG